MNPENLNSPWQAGESGNPSGGSKKQRTRMYLRDFLRNKGTEQADPEIIKEIIGETVVDLENMSKDDALAHMRELLEAGLCKGEVVAHRMYDDAMGTGQSAATARAQIISTEPKTIEVENHTPPVSPEFVPTEAEQAALEHDAGGEGETVH